MKRDPRTDQEIINAVLAAACAYRDHDWIVTGDQIRKRLDAAVDEYRRRIRERDGELMEASVP